LLIDLRLFRVKKSTWGGARSKNKTICCFIKEYNRALRFVEICRVTRPNPMTTRELKARPSWLESGGNCSHKVPLYADV
jgi:hypothetical protein